METVSRHASRRCERIVELSPRAPFAPGTDPALLAFVKCHLSSFLRWDVLRVLTAAEGRWMDLESLGSGLHKPIPALRHALEELVAEGIVEEELQPGAVLAFRLN